MKELWTEKYRPKTVDGYVFSILSKKRVFRICCLLGQLVQVKPL